MAQWLMTAKHRKTSTVICLALLILIAAVYMQVASHDFLLYDDPNYVTSNSHVRAGLALDNIIWAFSSFHDNNWFPLTWISHMLDVQLFGVAAGWHHLVNVALHAANSLLLFLLLTRLTNHIWRSAIVAALFALHPIHVESVAWVAERKDVLSTFFLLLTLHAYRRYTSQPGAGRYILILLLFALGLMAKPMLVSLPLIMLLLDYWPLGRFAASDGASPPHSRCRSLLIEKIPFALLAVGSGAITVMAQKEGISSLQAVPFMTRLANAAVAYAAYIGKTLLPLELSVFYPLPLNPVMWKPMAATLLLAAVTLAVWHWRKRLPYLIVGWLWYLVTLVPVIGLVQIGMQALADRYTYVPIIGLFIMTVWLGADIAASGKLRMKLATWVTVIVIIAYAGMAWRQVSYWKDNGTLFAHALDLDKRNFIAWHVLGIIAVQQGDYPDALAKFANAIDSAPWFSPSYLSAGNALMDIDRTEEALGYFETALKIRPNAAAHYNLGSALHRLGNLDDAVQHYRLALGMNPGNSDYLNNLGIALAEQGDIAAAISLFEQVLKIDPAYDNARENLKKALTLQKNSR